MPTHLTFQLACIFLSYNPEVGHWHPDVYLDGDLPTYSTMIFTQLLVIVLSDCHLGN